MNELLNFISLHKWKILGGLLGLFTAIITPLIVSRIQERLRHRKLEKARKRIAGIATEEELRERVKSLPKEKKEKIESCFVPGVKELEAGRKLLQFGQEAQAKSRFEEAIKFFICAADALPCYETFYNLAKAYNDYCDYDNAKENYQKAIQHDPTQPGAYNGLGLVYLYTSNYPKAKEYSQQALAKAEKLTDQQAKLTWQANALNNLGAVCCQTGQVERALAYHQQVLRIYREIGNKLGEANTLMNLGGVYFQAGQMEQALAYYQQALEIHREIRDEWGEANDLIGMGNVYADTDQMEQAIKRYQQSLEIHQEIGNKLGKAHVLTNLGIVYADTGQTEQAREHFLLARAIFEEIGTPHLVKQTDENLAKLPGS